jgi:NDP-mannose synthase
VKTVILAGGLGTRLKPFTEIIPKPLLPLGDKSILEHQILSLREFGCTDVYVATNYMADLVEAFVGDGKRFGLRVHVSREDQPLGTAGPLKLLEKDLREPFLVINGDIITKLNFRNLYEFGSTHNAALTVGTKIITTPFRFGNVVVEDDAIVSVEEKPDFKLEIIAGVYCMTPEIFHFIPPATYFGVDSLIRNLLAAKQRISRYLIEEYWLDIGQVEDYSKARDLYTSSFGPAAGPKG